MIGTRSLLGASLADDLGVAGAKAIGEGAEAGAVGFHDNE